MMAAETPEVTHRRPARSFASLEPMSVTIDPSPRPDDGPSEEPFVPPAAEDRAGAFLNLEARIAQVEASVASRFGLLEERVEKLDTIVGSLEEVVDNAPDRAREKTLDTLVRHIVKLCVEDKLLSFEAAMTAIGRELGIEAPQPSRLEARAEALRNASPAALELALERRSAPAKKRAAKKTAKRKPGRPKKTAAAKAPTPPGNSPADFLARMKAAGLTQAKVADAGRVSQKTVSRWVLGQTELTRPMRSRLWYALEQLEARAKGK